MHPALLIDVAPNRSTALQAIWHCIGLARPNPDLAATSTGHGTAPPGAAEKAAPPYAGRLSNSLAHQILRQQAVSSRVIEPLGQFMGLAKSAVADLLGLDRSTLSRRAAKDQPLPLHAAEGVLRLLELEQLASDTFETASDALQWLHRPHPLLEGEPPLMAAKTAYGAQRVKDMLLAIRYGGVV